MLRRDLIDQLAGRMLADAIATGNRIANPTAYRKAISENLEHENSDAALEAMLAGYAERDTREAHGQKKPRARLDPIETALSAYRRKLADGAPDGQALAFALDAAAIANGELDQALERRVLAVITSTQPTSDPDDPQIAARYQRIALAADRHPALAESVRELCGPAAQPSGGYTPRQLANIVRLLEQTAGLLGVDLGPLRDANADAILQILATA